MVKQDETMEDPSRVDVSPLLDDPETPFHYRGQWNPDWMNISHELVSMNHPLTVDFKLRKVNDRIHAEGSYAGSITAYCSRCLTEIEQEVHQELTAQFRADGPPPKEEEEEPEKVYFGHFDPESQTIDLWDVIRRDIINRRPMRPLCREDCEGLCPVCGQNLNEGDCGHETETVDPRLEKLSEIELEPDS